MSSQAERLSAALAGRYRIERELGARLAGRTAAHPIDQPPEVEPPPVAVVAGLCTCGTSNDSDAIFCKRCGAKLTVQ